MELQRIHIWHRCRRFTANDGKVSQIEQCRLFRSNRAHVRRSFKQTIAKQERRNENRGCCGCRHPEHTMLPDACSNLLEFAEAGRTTADMINCRIMYG